MQPGHGDDPKTDTHPAFAFHQLALLRRDYWVTVDAWLGGGAMGSGVSGDGGL